MQIMIDIPDEDIPKRQDVLTVDFVFIDGHISQCDYPFEEVHKGKWLLDKEQTHIEKTYHCSECGLRAWGNGERTSYCPECGAKMEESDVENE